MADASMSTPGSLLRDIGETLFKHNNPSLKEIGVGIKMGTPWAHGFAEYYVTKSGKVFVVIGTKPDASGFDASPSLVLHEFGHAIGETELVSAPRSVQAAIRDEYEKWVSGFLGPITHRDVMNRSAIEKKPMREAAAKGGLNKPIGSPEYHASFDEWFADQVAKWGTTDSRPMGLIEKFFKGVADKIRALFGKYDKYLPEKSVSEFMDSLAKRGKWGEPEVQTSETVAPSEIVPEAKPVALRSSAKPGSIVALKSTDGSVRGRWRVLRKIAGGYLIHPENGVGDVTKYMGEVVHLEEPPPKDLTTYEGLKSDQSITKGEDGVHYFNNKGDARPLSKTQEAVLSVVDRSISKFEDPGEHHKAMTAVAHSLTSDPITTKGVLVAVPTGTPDKPAFTLAMTDGDARGGTAGNHQIKLVQNSVTESLYKALGLDKPTGMGETYHPAPEKAPREQLIPIGDMPVGTRKWNEYKRSKAAISFGVPDPNAAGRPTKKIPEQGSLRPDERIDAVAADKSDQYVDIPHPTVKDKYGRPTSVRIYPAARGRIRLQVSPTTRGVASSMPHIEPQVKVIEVDKASGAVLVETTSSHKLYTQGGRDVYLPEGSRFVLSEGRSMENPFSQRMEGNTIDRDALVNMSTVKNGKEFKFNNRSATKYGEKIGKGQRQMEAESVVSSKSAEPEVRTSESKKVWDSMVESTKEARERGCD
jgi:hypothetical protein